MSQNILFQLRAYLKDLDRSCKVVSYGYLCRKFKIPMRKLLNLLQIRLYDLCHVVVGKVRDTYLITTSGEMRDYQIKKLYFDIKELSTISDQKTLKQILKRIKSDISLDEKRIIALDNICLDELKSIQN